MVAKGGTRVWAWIAWLSVACGSGAGPQVVKASCGSPGETPSSDPGDALAAQRAWPTCAFDANATTATTIGPLPASETIPPAIQHVIVLLRENHSFDNYLSMYQPSPGETVDVASTTDTNPDPSNPDAPGAPVVRYHDTRYCIADTNHEWSATHLEFDNGRMDGFVAANNNSATGRGGARAMGYYTSADLPFYYWLAANFAISDRYFSAYLGPTHSNIMFYYKATSCGYAEGIDTNPGLVVDCGSQKPTIFSELDAAKVSYKLYSDTTPPVVAAAVIFGVYDASHGVGSIDDFAAEATAGNLPMVAFVEPNYGKIPGQTEDDEHPPTNVQIGERDSWRVVNALMSSKSWASSILFVTWDEHGGYYDHVVPPHACDPGGYDQRDFKFDRYGIRVPLFAVSPYARGGHVSHVVADHTSIARFIEHWKGLPAMTKRDANAWPLLDMFDFTTARVVAPPDMSLAPESTDPANVGTCNGTGGTGGLP